MPLKFLFPLWLLMTILISSGCTSIIGATTNEPITIDPGKRSLGVKIDDQQIETIASVNIDKAHALLDQAPVSAHSFNAVVLLVGQVPTSDMRELAGATVKKLPNVRQVHNELQVQAPISLLDGANDSWLTTKIKSKLLTNRDIDGGRLNIITENNTVFLMGLVTHAEAKVITDIARHTGGVQKVVRVFEYID
ncbi:BON domain-containing protein [Gilvimarinus agarilyticus]|uniref:BON domain-containing protein n=1 Tax=unclassified Gilvimarinus TaxID=2642066 RepID=UPI001C0A34C2|nr:MULTISPECIES: BON domain-containing protein [unclassified Gilvimarinus]MBU2885388.1 BON domain-containing protein [Gilvimarinus agarilyticus]MDO6570287.1 BON domain-containing protein [Gilvimarinus sp. 2_MG-2023]MDO6746925.1 BON domain-containing protein [Gilvimarinus sp. 1_MG-2023]